MNSEDELASGTDPTSGGSAFIITVRSTPSGGVELRWPNLPSRLFEIQFTADAFNWQTMTNAQPWLPDPSTAVWAHPSSGSNRFYRVVAMPE